MTARRAAVSGMQNRVRLFFLYEFVQQRSGSHQMITVVITTNLLGFPVNETKVHDENKNVHSSI
ncbi:hypothetical protein DNH61_15335 [Paenibacillus sambharensis]|uniref:Uncharacterized protein n=1 Tax=Paenibacillus sambharensis TaxID=1803190 RepID=A0A2W1LT39_9BACL|nr:hypothetical protein DNH61_15335 [Paenibacillus sambharensis]